MVIDTSVIMAILLNEPSRSALESAILADQYRLISVASVLEVSIGMSWKKYKSTEVEIDALLDEMQVLPEPVDSEQLTIARQAFRRFGKGRHPAALNFGDCFPYALAQQSGEPLLFVGEDFSKTDISAVAWE